MTEKRVARVSSAGDRALLAGLGKTFMANLQLFFPALPMEGVMKLS
jgi:hypothetical protein